MDFLFDNPLATMNGIYFLIFYGFVILFTIIILAIVKSQIDKSDKLNLPPISSNIDPYEIAYLRGGTNEMARSVVFGLMQKGFIEIKNEAKTSEIKRIDPKMSVSGLPQIEQLALNWIGASREAKEVFSADGLTKQLESYGQTYQAQLENAQMLTDSEMRSSFSPMKWTAFLVIFGLGCYKLLAAIANGNFNVIFLVIFCIIGLIITASVSKFSRLTKLGKTNLERLQLAFDNLKYQAQAPYIPNGTYQGRPQTAFAGVDPLLLSVGVFGSAILAGTVYDSYNQAFQRAQNQSVASGSSCGSGCGSCSSSSSSSSCSSGDGGGSSCGGGCGGCGGGCS